MQTCENVSRFLAQLAPGKSAHTVAAYRRDLAELAAYLQAAGVHNWAEVTAKQARAYPAKLHQRGLSGRSIARMLSAARMFYRYLVKSGDAAGNPFDGIVAPKTARKLPATLSVDEVSALLDAEEGGGAAAVRDRAMLELLYSSGLRLAELARLDCDGVDFAKGEVRVLGKGAKTRIVPVGQKAIVALQKWLQRRAAMAATAETALFVNKYGRRLSMRGIQDRLNRFAQKRGLGRRLHPHMLRHSFASHVLASSGDLRAVQEMLGHANVNTTQVYTHLDFQHLARVYDAAHPRALLTPP